MTEFRDAEHQFDALFDGKMPVNDAVEFLNTLRNRGESVAEIVGAARAMRGRMIPVSLGKPAIDICGTGGVEGDRFNISTAASFALAGIGIPIAKHGNRGSRIPNGSFDFLEALGLPIQYDAAVAETVFNATDLCFLFARQFHPAVGAVADIRRQVGGRTIFNLIGPLCNPAHVTRQIIGTTSIDIAERLALAIQHLGTERTIIVVGAGGRDELVPDGPSRIIEVTPERLIRYTVDPIEWMETPLAPLSVGLAEANAALFNHWLAAPESVPTLSHLIALNCGVALYLVNHVDTFRDGYERALDLIHTPVVRLKVAQYKDALTQINK